MPKYKVLLRGQGVLMEDETGERQRAGFYVSCCVDAADRESAADLALDELRRHPRYRALERWSGRDKDPLPPVVVDSVDAVTWRHRDLALGITTGFIFYLDTDQQPEE